MGKHYEKSYTRKACGNASRKQDVEEPRYFCKTCTKCVNSKCTFYDRHVDVKYNRCFYHSNYSPLSTVYREPNNLRELVLENEKAQCA